MLSTTNKYRTYIIVFTAVVIAVMIVFRLSLPNIIKKYANETLAQANNYSGEIGDIDLALWKGSYIIENIKIGKVGNVDNQPLFSAEAIEFSIIWSTLLTGQILGHLELETPEINFYDANTEAGKQTGESENWLGIANNLFPFPVDEVNIKDGVLAFHNLDADPEIHISTKNISLSANNFALHQEDDNPDLLTIVAQGNTMDSGKVEFDIKALPNKSHQTFEVKMQAKEVALEDFEGVLNHYAPFDLEAGHLDFTLELASINGELDGYIKPIFTDVEVFSWEGDIVEDGDGLIDGGIELLAGALSELFENQFEDSVSTTIPLKGSLKEVESSRLEVIKGILQNAFSQWPKAKTDKSPYGDKQE